MAPNVGLFQNQFNVELIEQCPSADNRMPTRCVRACECLCVVRCALKYKIQIIIIRFFLGSTRRVAGGAHSAVRGNQAAVLGGERSRKDDATAR